MMNLRKVLGTRPLIQCGATVIVFDGSQRVLMLRRTDNNQWCFPGGSMELGERLEDTARREVLEEAGIHVDGLELLNVFSGAQLYYQYPQGDEVYNVDVVYCAHEYRGEIRINEESSEHGFFSLQEIPHHLSPPQRAVVAYLKQHLTRSHLPGGGPGDAAGRPPSCVLCSPELAPVVAESPHWLAVLNRNQNVLGKLMLVCRRHVEAVAEMTEDEWSDLRAQVRRTTGALTAAFAPDHFNYMFLQNQDRHVHLHVVPRYLSTRTAAGLTFEDPDFAVDAPVSTAGRSVDRTSTEEIVRRIKVRLEP